MLKSPQINSLLVNYKFRTESALWRFFNCTKLHKFAQFLKRRFYRAAPVLAGPGRPAQSAQKEAGLARRRGGGASARKGGQEGVISSASRRLSGAHIDGGAKRQRVRSHARGRLVASGWVG